MAEQSTEGMIRQDAEKVVRAIERMIDAKISHNITGMKAPLGHRDDLVISIEAALSRAHPGLTVRNKLMTSPAPTIQEGAINEIAAERRRQIDSEGWSTAHDDAHSFGEMARAAACYAIPKPLLDYRIQNPGATDAFNLIWPFNWDRVWFKRKDRRRDLVRAGALIVAEIERIDRAAKAQGHQP